MYNANPRNASSAFSSNYNHNHTTAASAATATPTATPTATGTMMHLLKTEYPILIPYQIDFQTQTIGKHISLTKRYYLWRFGFAHVSSIIFFVLVLIPLVFIFVVIVYNTRNVIVHYIEHAVCYFLLQYESAVNSKYVY